MDKRVEQVFTNKSIQMAKKDMKRYLTLLVIRIMQIKTTVK